MMFIQSRFQHVHIRKQIWIKTGIICCIMIGRWRSSLFGLKDRVFHLNIILEFQRFSCLLLVCVGVDIVWDYFTYCVSAEVILLGWLVVVDCFCCVALIGWGLGAILLIVYLVCEGGLFVLLRLLLVKWVFVLRNTLCAFWDAVVINTALR